MNVMSSTRPREITNMCLHWLKLSRNMNSQTEKHLFQKPPCIFWILEGWNLVCSEFLQYHTAVLLTRNNRFRHLHSVHSDEIILEINRTDHTCLFHAVQCHVAHSKILYCCTGRGVSQTADKLWIVVLQGDYICGVYYRYNSCGESTFFVRTEGHYPNRNG